ncbi:hypothetical protein J2S19_002424 [Metabacillus malikii]|uniref:Uncharacterized protein n=1 Tax=Metabacillus malikii TaxID=1504265 RepID=A0ABT9ZFV4_9BACI|nr:hypothetical protein [Metabacillus malikii]
MYVNRQVDTGAVALTPTLRKASSVAATNPKTTKKKATIFSFSRQLNKRLMKDC